ncbi:unnamed protein product, partial [Polarella glacialis]
GGGKAGVKLEKRSRTVFFRGFKKDTPEDAIKLFVRQKLEGVSKELIDDVYTFDPFADKGVVRFTTEEAMWDFMVEKKGNRRHDYEGQVIYVNVDQIPEVAAKERAVRKVVRAIIEMNGGDGDQVKQTIRARYKSGLVWWNNERVAEWNQESETMTLLGAAAVYAEKFNLLMNNK